MKVDWVLSTYRDIWTVKVDEEPYRQLHIKIVRQPPDQVAMQTLTELNQWLDQLEYQGVKRYVLYRLSKQNLPTFSLRKKLREYRVSPSCIEQVLDEFVQMGYIDDQQWIELQIQEGLRRKDGIEKIKRKLYFKGAPKELLEEHFIEETDVVDAIKSLIATKYRRVDLKDYKARQKLAAALHRKGYSFESIFNALEQLNS